jgi:hypothetical protein
MAGQARFTVDTGIAAWMTAVTATVPGRRLPSRSSPAGGTDLFRHFPAAFRTGL